MREKLNAEDIYLVAVEKLLDKTTIELDLEEMDIIWENYTEGFSPERAAKKVREFLSQVRS